MNILYLADPSPVSHDVKWMNHFLEEGHKVFFLTRPTTSENVNHDHLGDARFIGEIHDFSIFRPKNIFKGFQIIVDSIKKYQIDIFHILYAEPNALWALFARFYNCKVILTTRGTDILVTIPQFRSAKNLSKLYVPKLYNLAFKQFDVITCTSVQQIASINKISKDAPKPCLIRTGIDISFVESFKKQNDHKSKIEGKYVFFPRSMKSLYNHEFAIRAISKMNSTFKDCYTFVFIGRDSKDVQYVKEISRLMENSPGVKFEFLNWQDRNSLYSLYMYASLVVMTPKSDGSPVSAFEAMAFQVPVILPPLNYDDDIFGKNVYQFHAWDENELTDLIEKALTTDNTKLIENAYITVLKRANKELEMKKLLRLYEFGG